MTDIESRISAVATAVRNSSHRAGLVAAVAASSARASLFAAANALDRGLITAHEFVSDFSEQEIEAAENAIGFRSARGLAA